MSRTKPIQRSGRFSSPGTPRSITDATTSPYRLATDSPSRQLQWELQQLAISAQEAFNAQLDLENEQREAMHKEALNEASARHERVRREAEQARVQLEQQMLAERKRRDEEAQRETARLRREEEQRIEAHRKSEEERARAVELEERKVAEAKRREREVTEKRQAEKERRDADAAKRVKEEQQAMKRQKEEAQAAKVKAIQNAPTLNPITSAQRTQQALQPTTLAQASPQSEKEHQRYLTIHQNLKDLRKGMASQAKQNAELKQAMGDMRREIKKSVGQVREGKGANSNQVCHIKQVAMRPADLALQLKTIMNVLRKAATLAEPSVDVTMYLASPPQQIDDSKGPALLVYLLNIFAKAIVAQFVDEAGVKPQIADPIGTVASHIFAISDLRWKEISLIDVLIAKFHVVCPVLFGIYGDEESFEGKRRLGWSKDEGGPFVPQQRHFERMTGLGAGFAGISLKNYEKARAKNPYPDHHYWQALARIANVPTAHITQTHFVVLKGMIEGYESKLLHFFGDAAMAALRHVLVDLPKRSPPSVASRALAGLPDVFRRDKKLVL